MIYKEFEERSKEVFTALDELRDKYSVAYEYLNITKEDFQVMEKNLKTEGIQNEELENRVKDMVRVGNLIRKISEHLLETHLDYLYEKYPGALN